MTAFSSGLRIARVFGISLFDSLLLVEVFEVVVGSGLFLTFSIVEDAFQIPKATTSPSRVPKKIANRTSFCIYLVKWAKYT